MGGAVSSGSRGVEVWTGGELGEEKVTKLGRFLELSRTGVTARGGAGGETGGYVM